MPKEQLHINKRFTLSLSNGFSLIEIIIAISVFLIFLIATVNITGSSIKQLQGSTNKERATALAEEGLEAVRNIRDNDFSNLVDGTYGLSASSQWNFSGISDTTGIFNRQITISTINSNQKKIISTITWIDQLSPTNSVILNTYLTNWKAILNIGLTIDKVVINHGGTKVASDFLPINLSTLAWDSTVDPPVQNLVSIPIVFAPSTMTLNDGTYTFSTSNDPSYLLTLSSACTGNTITLASGDAKICTITYEQNVVPTVTTPTSASVTQTSATLGANITSLGIPAAISARGICYGITVVPTTNCTPEGGTTTGIYTQNITGLNANTLYYYRGYATNATGTAYSTDGTFTTLSNTTIPTVTTTSPITSIARTTSTSGGNVTSDGGASVTARGVVWDTNINPTIALSTKTSNGTGTGSYSSNITGLSCNTLYHVRAYATNSVGTAYGSDVTFTTLVCSNIIYIASASASGTTVTIPAHNVGDLLLVFAYRSSSNTVPTVPSGWTSIDGAGMSNNASVFAYRIATGSDTSGTWTNATQLVLQIYRGVSASPIGGFGIHQAANSTTVTYPSVTMSVTDGSSWIVGSAGAASATSNVQNPPTGMVLRTNPIGASAEAAGFDTNGGVTSWTAKTVVISAGNVKWSARTVEIKSN